MDLLGVSDVRVFRDRTSMGHAWRQSPEGDRVISLSILRHVEATADERADCLKRTNAA